MRALIVMLLMAAMAPAMMRQAEAAGAELPLRKSAGCGAAAEPPIEAIRVDGHIRELILVLPEGGERNTPRPLVMAFHGRTNSNAQVRAYYGLRRTLERTAVVAYPSALRQADGTFSWTVPRDGLSGPPDLALFDALLTEIGGRYCVDLGRVFLVGHSLGASFANTLACARAERVRAVASVGGGIWTRGCTDPVAALVVHNPKDRLVAVELGREVRDVFLLANGLEETAPQPAAGRQLHCRRYGDATEPNPVVWCPHRQDYKADGRYYPHNWPESTELEIARFFGSLP